MVAGINGEVKKSKKYKPSPEEDSKQKDAEQAQKQKDLPTINAELANSVLTPNVKQQLGNVSYSGYGAFDVKGGHSDLNTNVTSAPYVHNTLDTKDRVAKADALLNKSSRQYKSREETGNDKKMTPPGFKNQRTGDAFNMLYNRGHVIGYAIAGSIKGFDASEANPKNIVTQTAWSNQASMGDSTNRGQNYYESLVRQALDKNMLVRYQVTPIYDQDNIVPSGMHIQAKSQDGALDFNAFVPNVQPGYVIDYKTGDAKKAE
ncbi:DNA/RNA non-specific endonuclease [Weissella uvarum]|nr:DNA/RNA non-specific endonuclease [Weissella uvarum]